MSYAPKNMQAYKKTSITTASKETVLLMLFEGCLKFLHKAKDAMLEKRIAEKGQLILKAHDIVTELIASLDYKANKDLAEQLESLYNFVTDELVRANIQNKPEHLDAAIKVMTILKEGWENAVKELTKKSPTAASPNTGSPLNPAEAKQTPSTTTDSANGTTARINKSA